MTDSVRMNPEGTEETSGGTPFTENRTPPCYKWAENLDNLLWDGDGVQVFRQFLEQEGCDKMLDFIYAFKGLQQVGTEQKAKISNIIKVMHRCYMQENILKIDPKFKVDVERKFHDNQMSGSYHEPSIYNCVYEEVFRFLRENLYPLFLESDIYLKAVQSTAESPKQPAECTSAPYQPVIEVACALPTLHEEEELKSEDCRQTPNVLPLNSSTLVATQAVRATSSRRIEDRVKGREGLFFPQPVPRHYHVSYAPTSERESENTSDAYTTDDAMSLTDSSIDGRDGRHGNRSWFRVNRRQQMDKNKGADLSRTVIPRTMQKVPQDRNLAEREPERFAEILIDKLKKVQKNQIVIEKLSKSSPDEVPTRLTTSLSADAMNTSTSSSDLSVLLKTLYSKDNVDDGNAQVILEEHMNRVFASSQQETPNRHSPDFPAAYRGPDVSIAANTSVVANRSLPLVQPNYGLVPTMSFDSGIEGIRGPQSIQAGSLPGDVCNVSSKELRQHRKSTTNSAASYGAQAGAAVPQSRANGSASFMQKVLYDDRPHRRHRTPQTEVSVKTQDSGVQDVVTDRMPNFNIPSNEKVLHWMLENDTYSAGSARKTASTDKSSQKSSHKSGSRSSQKTQPKQPIVQDPGMPPLQPPNTIVQLEETSRRLMDTPDKSKSFTASSLSPGALDRLAMPPPDLPPRSSANRTFSHPPPPPPPAIRPQYMNTSLMDDPTLRARPLSSRHSVDGGIAPSAASASIQPSHTPDPLHMVQVMYYNKGDEIPYMIKLKGPNPTLGQFKQQSAKKGREYKYFFKEVHPASDVPVVWQELVDDLALLPHCNGKIIGKVEKVET